MKKTLDHLIVGPGAVGLGLASFLAEKSSVALLGRPGSIPPSEITLTGQGLDRSSHVISFIKVEALTKFEAIDVVWIATPAYEVSNALSRINPYLSKTNLIVITSNGLGLYDEAKNIISGEISLARGLIEVGFKRVDNHTDVISGKPKIVLAGEGINNKLKSLSSRLDSVSWITSIEPDVHKAEWVKVLFNVLVNPVCAIAGCQNEKVLTDLFPVAQQAVNEARSVALSNGIDLSEITDEHLRALVEFSRTNICSTLAQLRRGDKLEIDYILGPIIRAAKVNNIAVPTLTLLNTILKYKEIEAIATHKTSNEF